ncbi:autotransporter outer membrane beta-barrel domain-containing protein [Microbulbifer guangxiensis]|uniref:autotransporter outer membrane beta-barrel domain-containing protein n=1 Tax=Microbulbifer guangxiensis TaxID=2904249 RepID=UPI001F02DA87|nr:autotransporter outer membrane beta-barrel domain-containing protein [Microbulbifer guangxiensis]
MSLGCSRPLPLLIVTLLLLSAQITSAQLPNGPVSTREELALYSQIKALAQQLSLQEVTGYQQRRGEQRLGNGGAGTGGLRLFHRNEQLQWRGDLVTGFEGKISGAQLHRQLYSGPTCRGSQELGFFGGSSVIRGDVRAAFPDSATYRAGQNEITSFHGGLYFSDYRHDLGYIDAMAKVSYVVADIDSARGLSTRVTGPQLTLSAERGLALTITEGVNLEPQLQIIANYTNFAALQVDGDFLDTDPTPEVALRAGLRIYPVETEREIYVFANYWSNLAGEDDLYLRNGSRLKLERGAHWGEIGGGITLLESSIASVFLNLNYRHSLDDQDWTGAGANLGFRWHW